MNRTLALLLLLLVAATGYVVSRNVGTRDASQGADPAPAEQGGGTAAAQAMPRPDPDLPARTARPDPEDGLRILVSIDQRRLWLVDGQDTLFAARVAVGMSEDFTYNGRRYHFATPRGTRRVLSRAPDPIWTVPEWHYYEKAESMGIPEVVKLAMDDEILLSDSSVLVVRDKQVGRINHFGNFAAFTPGTEIIFDDRLYIPPPGSAQRRVPDALGPYKLDTGDGYLIHGTHPYNEESIGLAVSHGCVRMSNVDISRLYPMVPRGTPVIIF